ncbi:queuosine precursor transporter [Pseudothermotoga sp. U03pept]|uniref:queuosine precursor transporter n=1 Tax=Pseudothermotoga sp. U03pept TaxID=3447012 RepID=UPI003EFE753B
MTNLLFLLAEYFLSCVVVLFATKYLKKEGLYIALATLIIASNLGVAKLFVLFGLEVTAANMSMGMAFAVYSIVTEVLGQREGRKAVWIGFFAQFAFVLLGLVYVGYLPSPNDIAQSYLKSVFSLTPRIAFASWTAYIISGYFAVWLHDKLKNRTKLWMRNNIATKLGQITDNLIFVSVAFFGVYDLKTLLNIYITTTVVEFVLDYIDTWIVYVGVSMLKKDIVTTSK